MRVDQARGGTNLVGVPPAAFDMPAGLRMRYDVPGAHLATCVTAYAVYISEYRKPMVNWYLPGPALISILLDAGQVSVSIRNRSYSDVDQATLYGPTTKALRTVTHGGIAIFIGLTAEGWARLTTASAGSVQNVATSLSNIARPSIVADLIVDLEALVDDTRIADVLDAHLPRLFGREIRNEGQLRRLSELLVTDGTIDLHQVVERIGFERHMLRRLALRHFGLTTKPLLTRARFLRSFAAWIARGEPVSYAGIDSSYYDASHFIRDSHSYLDMTPKQFAQLDTIFLKASLRARAAVLGAPAHALHVPPALIGSDRLGGSIGEAVGGGG